jgi:hypothetical protein
MGRKLAYEKFPEYTDVQDRSWKRNIDKFFCFYRNRRNVLRILEKWKQVKLVLPRVWLRVCHFGMINYPAGILEYWRKYCISNTKKINMDKAFKDFLNNITLTSSQQEDAKKKYTGVCQKLYSKYYGAGEFDSNKKFLFGSYKTKTNIRPLTSKQDVDVLFKIPQDVFDKFDKYKGNGQAALLQEVKDVLKEKYTTTDTIKAWGKVVLVQFSENHHNVELLPALEQEDGTFLIPNSENGGSWETFDPRSEIKEFEKSNNCTDNLTKDLTKILKAWAHNTVTMSYKSCERLKDIISFLSENYSKGREEAEYSKVVFDFFDYLRHRGKAEISTHAETAYKRAQKALEYADAGKERKASEEWIQIFGSEFPLVKENSLHKTQCAYVQSNPSRPWFN